MTDKRYTEDEIRAALERAACKTRADGLIAGDFFIAELTRPEIAPDVVVTYEWRGDRKLVNYFEHLPEGATNIMPHYPEDKVLEWASTAYGLESLQGATRYWQAKMDAYKRGEG